MKILLPLNGMSHAHKAIPQARRLAERWQAEVVLLRAIDPLAFAGETFASLATQRLEQDMLEAARDYLGQQSEKFAGLSVRTRCVVGPARESIRAQAFREKCDLVVMAPYAYGPIVRWMIGSVAEGVAHGAPCPVLLVRGESRPEPRHMLVPVDGSQLSGAVLDHLAPFVTPETSITVLHCCGVPQEEARQSEATGSYLDRLRYDLERLVSGRARHRLVMLDSQAPEGILEWLQKNDCDLVAMSTHGAGGFEQIYLGSVTDQVARQSPCPVLVFPPGSGSAGQV
ncbi:MAG: universal stress protein [Candidatus Eremiobacteraeota bacterium]|nr:universal stress protein [Candidatus Eremiobacteraeota bacterium]MCW5871205.1 universal stress protein [Candidatus Eremiobacteraeota bacterium]